MLGFINPFMVPLAAAAVGLDYLRRLLLPSAPSTAPVGAPYTPPFTGGQCVGVAYAAYVRATYPNGLISYSAGSNVWTDVGLRNLILAGQYDVYTTPIQGIQTFSNVDGFGGTRYTINGINGAIFPLSGGSPPTLQIIEVQRVDNLPDTCGNLPNPNPAPPIPNDGLASVASPDLSSDTDLVLGSPLVAIPSLASVIAAIVSAVNAAANALDAIRLVMDALAAISNVLDEIKRWIEDRDKEDEAKKSLKRHDFGSIRKDGFLRLYPNGDIGGFAPQYIDIQMLSIPLSYGRYFGNLSPNFYRFKSLGYISFVSPTFGIISTHEIEFSRVSLNVPDNAFGFFYHLGLDDTLRANVSMFYLQSQ